MGTWGPESYAVLTLFPYFTLNAGAWGLLAQFHWRVTSNITLTKKLRKNYPFLNIQFQVNRCIKSWLYQNRKDISLHFRPEEVVLISAEIHNQATGMECMFFTITYTFLGSVCPLALSILMLVPISIYFFMIQYTADAWTDNYLLHHYAATKITF